MAPVLTTRNSTRLSPTPVESVGTITLYGNNIFNNNGADGLNAVSHDDIVSYGLTANQNGDDGVSLTVKKDQPALKSYVVKMKVKVGKKFVLKNVTIYYYVTAANVTLLGTNSFVGNKNGNGLDVSADGAIAVYNLTANGNGTNVPDNTGSGAILDNCNSCAARHRSLPRDHLWLCQRERQ